MAHEIYGQVIGGRHGLSVEFLKPLLSKVSLHSTDFALPLNANDDRQVTPHVYLTVHWLSVVPSPQLADAHAKGLDLLLEEAPAPAEERFSFVTRMLEAAISVLCVLTFQPDIPPVTAMSLWTKLGELLEPIAETSGGAECLATFIETPVRLLLRNPTLQLQDQWKSMWQRIYEAKTKVDRQYSRHLACVLLGLLSDDTLKSSVSNFLASCATAMLVDCDLGQEKCDEILMLATLILKASHFTNGGLSPGLLSQLLSGMTRVLRTARSPEQLVRFLGESQDTIILYLNEHKPENLEPAKLDDWDSVKAAVENLWDGLLTAVQTCYTTYDSVLLHQLTNLLAATFTSKHRSIKSASINFWQKTFARAETLDYPERLNHPLAAAQRLGKLTLPKAKPKEEPVNPQVAALMLAPPVPEKAGSPILDHLPPEGKLADRAKRKVTPTKAPPAPKRLATPPRIDQSQDYLVIPPKPVIDDDATQKEEYVQLPPFVKRDIHIEDSAGELVLKRPVPKDTGKEASPAKRQKLSKVKSIVEAPKSRAVARVVTVSQEYSLQIVDDGASEPMGSEDQAPLDKAPADLTSLPTPRLLNMYEELHAFQTRLWEEIRKRV